MEIISMHESILNVAFHLPPVVHSRTTIPSGLCSSALRQRQQSSAFGGSSEEESNEGTGDVPSVALDEGYGVVHAANRTHGHASLAHHHSRIDHRSQNVSDRPHARDGHHHRSNRSTDLSMDGWHTSDSDRSPCCSCRRDRRRHLRRGNHRMSLHRRWLDRKCDRVSLEQWVHRAGSTCEQLNRARVFCRVRRKNDSSDGKQCESSLSF